MIGSDGYGRFVLFFWKKRRDLLKNKNNQNVTNYEIYGFILINNKQSRFHFNRTSFHNSLDIVL